MGCHGIVVTLLIVVFFVSSARFVDEIPTGKTSCAVAAAEESRDYYIFCSINGSNVSTRGYEVAIRKDGCNPYCARCISSKSRCNDRSYNKTRYFGKKYVYKENDTIRIAVHISKVSRWDEGQWYCSALFDDREAHTFPPCELRVYAPPEDPIATYNLTEADVTVKYTTNRIYPQAACRWDMSIDGEVQTDLSAIVYEHESYTYQSIEYFRSTCTLTQPLTQPGKYVFRVTLYPYVEGYDLSSKDSAYRQQILNIVVTEGPWLYGPARITQFGGTGHRPMEVHSPGDAVPIVCFAEGKPEPDLTIYYINDDGQIDKLTSAIRTRLEYRAVANCEASSTYICTASNEYNKEPDRKSTYLLVSCPLRLLHESDQDKSFIATLGGHAYVAIQVAGYPAPTKYQLNIQQDGGMFPFLENRYKVDYGNDPQNPDLRGGIISLVIYNLENTEFTSFSLTAENGVGKELEYRFNIAEEETKIQIFNIFYIVAAVIGATVIVVVVVVFVIIYRRKQRLSQAVLSSSPGYATFEPGQQEHHVYGRLISGPSSPSGVSATSPLPSPRHPAPTIYSPAYIDILPPDPNVDSTPYLSVEDSHYDYIQEADIGKPVRH